MDTKEGLKRDLEPVRAGAEDLVRTHPYVAVAAGAAAGIGLGMVAAPLASRANGERGRSWTAALRRIVGAQALRSLVG